MDLSCYFRQDYNYCIDKSESNRKRERDGTRQIDGRADRWMDGHSVVMQRLAREWDAPLSWELQTRGVSPSTTVARRQLVIGDLF